MQVDEDRAALLLPTIAAGISGGASADFRAAAFMVATQLAARVPLSPTFLDGKLRDTQFTGWGMSTASIKQSVLLSIMSD